jgi:NAD-dependent deacetylase
MIGQVRDWVRAAQRLAVLTGAGMSAESGVPTFRDAQTGLWAQFDPEQLATEDAFRANPKMVWDWYAFRRELIAKVEPNAGHRALARFAQGHLSRLTLITQNVDGLHQRAGSRGVLALHGNIFEDNGWMRPRPAAMRTRPPRAARLIAADAATCCVPTWSGSARPCRCAPWPPRKRQRANAT